MSGEPLRPGEPVTLLLPDHVVMVEVNTSSRVDFTVQLSSRGEKTYTSRWGLNEEGVGWLRGYHTADSREVEAARAAKGLEPVEASTTPGNPGIPHFMPNSMHGPIGPLMSGGGSGAVSREEVKSLMQQFLDDKAKSQE
jgi:hypothetical protein